MGTPAHIFYSYSHEDETLLKELKAHLAPLKNRGIIQEWYDRKIRPGNEWPDVIDKNLENADLIILLVSASFLCSEYCYWKELRRALEKHNAGEAQVIPVIARPCIWQETSLQKLQALPKDGKAVTTWDNRDEAWVNVAEGIHNAIDSPALQLFYRQLCKAGRQALIDQTVEIVPFLNDVTQDKRLGLTLIVRPSIEVATQLTAINDQLRQLDPRHFYYDSERFHFTILSLINATDSSKVTKDSAELFKRPIDKLLNDFPPFNIEFSGICATPNSIIAKGFPIDDTLDRLRDTLRNQLTSVGLGSELDERYRIQGAHITLTRFKVLEDLLPMVELLDQLRDRNLGLMHVHRTQLVINDFYMSPNKVQVVSELSMGGPDSLPLPKCSKMDMIPQAAKLHNLPIKPISFVGRDDEHEYIFRALHDANKPVIITSGFGGIGKSTLAKMVAWSCVEQQRPFDFIAWIDTRQYEESQMISFNFVLDEIAKAADSNSDIPSISNIDIKQDRIRELLKSHRSLLILDNYESLFADPKEEQKVSAFLASLPIGPSKDDVDTYIRVLITTREVSSRLRELPMEDVLLKKLSLKDSVELMKASTPKRLKLTDEQYRRIWEILCGLPKYMQIAVDQLRSITFEQWEKMVTNIEMPLDEGERFFRDLFGQSWKRFPEGFRKILMSITYFVGEASPEALLRTSGLSEKQFCNILASASDAYIENTGTGYTVHALTHSYCRAILDSASSVEFRQHAAFRFVEHFSEFTKTAHESDRLDSLEREIRNIVAAARLAHKLQAWSCLIELRQHTATFLRIRGYWQEQTEITQLAAIACGELGEEEMLAKCLVDDLGWLFLRFEDLEQAEDYINRGLEIFQKLGLRKGIAQAMRHLGKSALLKGLDQWYEPNESSKEYFDEAERYYQQSLQIREALIQEGLDQRMEVGDMKLDFGRLYWLQGKKYERDGREHESSELIKKALRKYEQADEASCEAMDIFEKIDNKRGIAKAWGNLGNATKEIVRFLLQNNQLVGAIQRIAETHEYYEKSLEVAKAIKRRDEVAHALWGLAEVHELFADNPDLHNRFGRKAKLLEKALEYIEESHKIYKSLGGGKDINATKRAIDQIKDKLLLLQFPIGKSDAG